MDKIKIHELAKKLNIGSKDIIKILTDMGIEVKNHLSSIDEDIAKKIEKKAVSQNKKNDEKNTKKEKTETPVIIRREVIITDEELARKDEEEKKKKENRKKEVGFVERSRNKDYNIVYRDRPSKPLTVSELFGLATNKKEEVKERTNSQVTASIEKEKNNTNQVKPMSQDISTIKTVQKSYERNINSNNSNYKNNSQNNNYRHNNQSSNSRSSGYRNNHQNGFQNNYNNSGQNNNNYRNNQNGGYSRSAGRRPLDEKGIEKNIKNIMATDIVEKESVRDYNKNISKQKINRYDENKTKKTSRSRRTEMFDRYGEDKLKSLKQENRLSNMFHDQEGGMLDYYDLTTQRGRKNKRKNSRQDENRVKQKIFELTEVTIPETITVKDLAAEMKKTTADVIKKLLGYGIMATVNNEIDFDTAFLIAEEFGIKAIKKEVITEEDILFDDSEDKEEELKARPPVVVVMGHVDHGKTSLLDAVRSTNVIEGEAGGITQHIGAYKVEINGREITFLDTPGHEAFTSMRARGAQVTDIAILVVAANDGVMPQTIEAINHAKAADIPIIVAVNKIDLEGANVEKVKQDLTKYELVPEEWGGDTVFVPISAKKHMNIDTLLEMVLLVADMKELKANPKKQAKGVVLEAKLDKTRGPVASMLVQRGTLDVGDTIVLGSVIGKIRTMTNDKGKKVKKAGPSTPVEITGLPEVPTAGDTFYEVKDEKTAKHLIERRKRQEREKAMSATTKVTLNDLFSQIEKGKLKQLNIIVKADVQGSVEAVKQSLEKLSNDEVQVKVIHANVGGVTESDVTLAKVSDAIIIAFNVRPEPIAKDIAKKEEVEIKQYSIIYQAIDDVEAAMKGMLDPTFEEKIIGTGEVRQTFKVSNVGTIAGCYVTDGKIARNAGIRIIRNNVVIHDGKLVSLKRFKDDVKEVASGYECGLQIENFNDIVEGDILEVYIMEEVKK